MTEIFSFAFCHFLPFLLQVLHVNAIRKLCQIQNRLVGVATQEGAFNLWELVVYAYEQLYVKFGHCQMKTKEVIVKTRFEHFCA